MAILLLGTAQSDVGLFGILLVLGFVVGVFGHIIHSRTLILAGILVVGVVSAYYAFVVARVR